MIKILFSIVFSIIISVFLSVCIFIFSRRLFEYFSKASTYKYTESEVARITGINLKQFPELIDILIFKKELETNGIKYIVSKSGLSTIEEYKKDKFGLNLKPLKGNL